jgi:membrane protein
MKWNKIIDFFTIEIWRIMMGNVSRPKLILIKFLRTTILSFRRFIENKDPLRTSALTYYSLLSIVPVLALIFGIAKGFGLEKILEKVILKNFEGQEEISMQIITFAHTLLANVKGELVAGIGIVILFYTTIRILTNIEDSFNDIWRVTKARNLLRKISDYLSIMLICPVLLILSSTITVVVTSQVRLLIQKIQIFALVSPLIYFLLKLLPYGMLWILFTFLYVFMPNTRVRFKSGLVAGIIAGTIYQLFQWGYISLQFGVARYNAIYGSFAAIPLFCIWLQTSWLIVLFGAEISFAYQNSDAYEFEKDCQTVSHSYKRLLALRVMHLIVKNFSNKEEALTSKQISNKLGMPGPMVQQIINDLTTAKLVSEIIRAKGQSAGFQPALDPDHLTIKYVINALEKKGSENIPVAQSVELQRLQEALQAFDELTHQAPQNIPLKKI